MARSGVFLLALSAAVFIGGAARAQQEPDGGQEGSGSPILIVSMERILRESGPSMAIQTRIEEVRAGLRADFQTREESLRAEEVELARLRETMDAESFGARAAEFKEKVRVLRRETNETGARLQRAVQNANGELKRALQPILLQLMSERRALVMLDEKSVVISAKALDVTQEAIDRLNAASPTIELRLPAAPGQ